MYIFLNPEMKWKTIHVPCLFVKVRPELIENLLKMFDKYRCLIITLLSSVKKKLNAFKESALKLMRKEFDNFGNSQLKIFYLYQLGQLIININHS